MFKDYYKILGISPYADGALIKQAYREMSIKWHPDKNYDFGVTSFMQDINEAYAILKDKEKRARYDQEYARFRGEFLQEEKSQEKKKTYYEKSSQTRWEYEYDVHDENLREDIKNARKYAKDIVEEFLKELKETSKTAAKGAATNAYNFAVGWIISGVILAIIVSLFKACN